MAAERLEQLRALLSKAELIERGEDGYNEAAAPWSIWTDKKPPFVVQPTSLQSMSQVVRFLYDSDLDFAIRNTGTGSVSAKDVILSTHGFQGFSFDEEAEVVTLGSGHDWAAVDQLMEERAPGYQLPSARCGWVGVAGSVLCGGLSWLSHEYGLISDPQNLLDVQVVLREGRVLWASEEPDLPWALRGGGGNFGVLTALRFRALPYPTKIFAGVLMFPYSSLQEVSKVVYRMHERKPDPRLAEAQRSESRHKVLKPGIAILMYDANGESHARPDEGFGWLYKVADVMEWAGGEMGLRDVNALADSYRHWQGNNMFWLSAPLIEDVDEETIMRAWKWWEDTMNLCEPLLEGSAILFEFMQKGAMSSAGGRQKTAFPHQGRRHVMQLCLGGRPETLPNNARKLVMQRFAAACREIAGEGKEPKGFHPGFLHEWNNLNDVYGENLPRLKQIKRHYDPKNRFNKGVDLMNEQVTQGPNLGLAR